MKANFAENSLTFQLRPPHGSFVSFHTLISTSAASINSLAREVLRCSFHGPAYNSLTM